MLSARIRNNPIQINDCIGAAWTRLRKHEVFFPTLRWAQCPATSKSGCLKQGWWKQSCTTVRVCCMDSASKNPRVHALSIHELPLRALGFRRKGRPCCKTHPCSDVLEMTNCDCIDTTTRECHLWFAAALVRQDEARLLKLIIFGRSVARWGQGVWPPHHTLGEPPPGEPMYTRGSSVQRSAAKVVRLRCGGRRST